MEKVVIVTGANRSDVITFTRFLINNIVEGLSKSDTVAGSCYNFTATKLISRIKKIKIH